MVPAYEDAMQLQFTCSECVPMRKHNYAREAIVSAGLIFIAVLPLIVYLLSRIKVVKVTRARKAPFAPWGKRERPWLVHVLFYLGWLTVLLGIAPTMLWYANDAWPTPLSGAFTSLTIPGLMMILMVLRFDDDALVFRTISGISILACVMVALHMLRVTAAMAPRLAMNEFSSMMPLRDIQTGPSRMPSSFRIWGVVLPMVISHALLVLGTVTLICAMLPILLTPLLPLPRCGAYTWLWRSMRSMCVFCAMVTLTTSAWMLIMIAALDSPYPSDVQVAKRQLISFGPLGPAWVIGVVFTSPRNRQRIHLISVQWFQGGSSALHVAPASAVATLAPMPTTNEGENPTVQRIDEKSGRSESSEHGETLLDHIGSIMLGGRMLGAWAEADLRDWVSQSSLPELTKGVTIDPDSIMLDQWIGTGGYSCVLRAQLVNRTVALKIFDRTAYRSVRELRRLHQEASIASKLQHPCVVQSIGTTTVAHKWPALVLEHLAGGTLYSRLHNPTVSPMTAAHRKQIALEVALGLEYLHANGVVHRDIKTTNVLLDSSEHAKISDFGIATRLGMEFTADVGTTRYMAPEVVFGAYNEKADVFSYAMLLWELMHVKIPFKDSPAVAAFLLICDGKRPSIESEQAFEHLETLIQSCWQTNPGARPTMKDVVRSILSHAQGAASDLSSTQMESQAQGMSSTLEQMV